jgi:hypothetical protein
MIGLIMMALARSLRGGLRREHGEDQTPNLHSSDDDVVAAASRP